MKLWVLLNSWLGTLLFLAGVLAGLFLSAAYSWGESEARLYTSYNGETSMRLNCPLMLSPVESGIVSADIINLTDKEIKPVVAAEVSHGRIPRIISETVFLAPEGSVTVRWKVDSSDVIFERLIVVSIRQSPYSDNPSRSGSCGILLFSLFGLTGAQTFGLILLASLLAMLSGGALWLYTRWPLNKFATNFALINAVLLGLTFFALLGILPRWWGLTLFLDLLTLLVMGVIIVEFGFFRDKDGD